VVKWIFSSYPARFFAIGTGRNGSADLFAAVSSVADLISAFLRVSLLLFVGLPPVMERIVFRFVPVHLFVGGRNGGGQVPGAGTPFKAHGHVQGGILQFLLEPSFRFPEGLFLHAGQQDIEFIAAGTEYRFCPKESLQEFRTVAD